MSQEAGDPSQTFYGGGNTGVESFPGEGRIQASPVLCTGLQDIIGVLHLLLKHVLTFSPALSPFVLSVCYESEETSGAHVRMPPVHPVPAADSAEICKIQVYSVCLRSRCRRVQN